MLFEIINPSDAYTIEAPDLKTAFVACCLLSEGRYCFKSLDGGEDVPIFLFGGYDEWCLKHFQQEAQAVIDEFLTNETGERKIADVLSSCILGGPDQRELYILKMAALGDEESRQKFAAQWDNDRRSSLNNIGALAYKIAARLRAPIEVSAAHGASPQACSVETHPGANQSTDNG